MAVQILGALTSARLIAVDTSADKLALARELGADDTVEPGETAAAEIREMTGGRGAELVLDNVGADETLELAAGVAAFKSHLAMVGLATGLTRPTGACAKAPSTGAR